MAGGNKLILLILTAIASLIIGLPLPPVTAYLILAILAAPALTKAGIPPHGSTSFCFLLRRSRQYRLRRRVLLQPPELQKQTSKNDEFSILDICPNVYRPLSFVYSPELMLKGSPFYVAFRVITAFIAISGISMSFLGFAKIRINVIERAIILIASVCLIPQVVVSQPFRLYGYFGIFWRQNVYPRLGARMGSNQEAKGAHDVTSFMGYGCRSGLASVMALTSVILTRETLHRVNGWASTGRSRRPHSGS